MDLKTLSIDTIGLSVRSVNCLHRAGVHTVEQMLPHTEQSLYEMRNMGKKSVDEVLEKIRYYQSIPHSQATIAEIGEEDFDLWLRDPESRDLVLNLLRREKVTIDALELLSIRSYNLLQFNGYDQLHQIAFLTPEQLMQLHRMTPECAAEIAKRTALYLRERRSEYTSAIQSGQAGLTLQDLMTLPAHRQAVLTFAKANDQILMDTNLSTRPKNQLAKNGYHRISDILFLTQEEIQRLPAMGAGSVSQVLDLIRDYLEQNQSRIIAYCSGDADALEVPQPPSPVASKDEERVRELILDLYREAPFIGLHFPEIAQALDASMPEEQEWLKSVIGRMIARRDLEYVDFRCYRVYPSFRNYMVGCTAIKERSKIFLEKRLDGMTLEAIAQEYGVTRERVRQVINDAGKVRADYERKSGVSVFDEDYYRYFYETYDFDHRELSRWLGIPDEVWKYLSLMDVKQGSQELSHAIEDVRNLDAGLRLKLKNYLNRDRLYVDGMWIEKKRPQLEQYVVQKYCVENTTYAEFVRIYNDFLTREEIPFSEELYITDAVYRSRKGILLSARFVLWKLNETLRYYDIEGRDFTELLEELNLESYENIEISTAKLMRLHPEILKKYDIRDQYELHNLLRKIVPEGSFHDFHCARMPEIRFGEFDRDNAIMDLLIAHSPIATVDLLALIQEEYGYDPGVAQSTYLANFSRYNHYGVYSVDQKPMTAENQALLTAALTGDFYYIDEIRRIYRNLIPGADAEEINPFNLKDMGFQVFSRYVLKNYPSLENYFETLLTESDIVDLTPIRKRFVYVQMFYQTMLSMKRDLKIVEFERNSLIRFQKLEQSGVTKEMIAEFCDQVYDFAPGKAYFTIASLKDDGFAPELFDLGFSDWFYSNLLLSDPRFSAYQIMNNLCFYKGAITITARDFLVQRIRLHRVIDYFDLVTELENRYGFRMANMRDILQRLEDTEVYHDRILDRFYANEDLYYQDLDLTGGF